MVTKRKTEEPNHGTLGPFIIRYRLIDAINISAAGETFQQGSGQQVDTNRYCIV
jgi:hypothetical protein